MNKNSQKRPKNKTQQKPKNSNNIKPKILKSAEFYQ